MWPSLYDGLLYSSGWAWVAKTTCGLASCLFSVLGAPVSAQQTHGIALGGELHTHNVTLHRSFSISQ